MGSVCTERNFTGTEMNPNRTEFSSEVNLGPSGCNQTPNSPIEEKILAQSQRLLHTNVHLDVLLQNALQCEGLRAEVAFEGTLARVRPHMPLKALVVASVLAADAALETAL